MLQHDCCWLALVLSGVGVVGAETTKKLHVLRIGLCISVRSNTNSWAFSSIHLSLCLTQRLSVWVVWALLWSFILVLTVETNEGKKAWLPNKGEACGTHRKTSTFSILYKAIMCVLFLNFHNPIPRMHHWLYLQMYSSMGLIVMYVKVPV